jgi:hypothetical protein
MIHARWRKLIVGVGSVSAGTTGDDELSGSLSEPDCCGAFDIFDG